MHNFVKNTTLYLRKKEEIIKEEIIKEEIIKEEIIKEEIIKEEIISNKEKLILDASCPPADIAFPLDLGLLNRGKAREAAKSAK